MSNELKKNRYRKLCILLIQLHGKYKEHWSKLNRDWWKICKNILINFIGYMIVKNFSCSKINIVKPLYPIILKESSGNKYLMLVRTNEGKDTLTKYGELWSKVRDVSILITNNWDNYDEKFMKIIFNSDNYLALK